MKASLESVRTAVPAHGKPARHVVHLELLNVVAAFQRVHCRAEPCNPSANNDDLLAVAFHGEPSLQSVHRSESAEEKEQGAAIRTLAEDGSASVPTWP